MLPVTSVNGSQLIGSHGTRLTLLDEGGHTQFEHRTLPDEGGHAEFADMPALESAGMPTPRVTVMPTLACAPQHAYDTSMHDMWYPPPPCNPISGEGGLTYSSLTQLVGLWFDATHLACTLSS